MMKRILIALLLPSIALAASGKRVGVNPAPQISGNGSSVSVTATGGPTKTLADWQANGPVKADDTTVTATGSTTARALKDRAADVVNVRNFTGGLPAAVAAAPAGGDVFIPQGETVYLTAPVPVSKNITIRGAGRGGSAIVAAAGQPMFTLTGTVNKLRIEGLDLKGGTRLIDTTGVTASEGHVAVVANYIHEFTNTAIWIGPSTYMITIRDNTFAANNGAIYVADNSDGVIENNFFNMPDGANPQVTLAGADNHLVNNVFVYGAPFGTGLGPDVLLKPTGTYLTGINWITNNKFGQEGDSASRVKILVEGSAGQVFGDTIITGNNFGGINGQTAIRLTNPIRSFHFGANLWIGFSKLIDDAFAPVADEPITQSVFDFGNRIWTLNSQPTALFTNGGRGFGRVVAPSELADPSFNDVPRVTEVPLRNRLAYSEDLSSVGWNRSGVTVTMGQADPLGGTRAVLLTRANAAAFEYVSANILPGSGLGKQLVAKLWGKAGSASTLVCVIYDNTASVGVKQVLTLGAGWKQYRIVQGGINPAHSYSLYLYPVSEAQAAGTIYVSRLQVADEDSDYLASSGSDAYDGGTGTLYERNSMFLGGAYFGGTAFAPNAKIEPSGRGTWSSAVIGGVSVTTGASAPSTDEPIGSLYLRTSGGSATTLYVKTAAGGAGWTAK